MESSKKYFFIGFASGAMVLFAVLLLGLYLYALTGEGRQAHLLAQSRKPYVPREARYDFELTRADGGKVSAETFRGQVNLLAFLDPGALDTLATLPKLESLHAQLVAAEKGATEANIRVVIVSPEEEWKVFAAAYKGQIPLLWAGGQVPTEYATQQMPVAYVLTKKGRIDLRYAGPANWADAEIVDYLRSLAK